MCQILQIKAGVSFSEKLLERSCDINPDGFGFVVRNKGQFIIERDITKNDHKKIGALLEKWKEKPRYLHLRFATKGAVNKQNNHPFVVFEKKGPQVLMMHNGTLSGDYEPVQGDEVTSDTLLFNQKFMQPLTERVWAYHNGKRSPLTDPIFRRALTKEVGQQWSIFLFIDTFGETLRINSDHGKDFDWGWASNEYSFNDNHSRSSARQTNVYRYRNDNLSDVVSHLWNGGGYPDMNGEGGEQFPWQEYTPPKRTRDVEEISSGWTEHGSKSAAASATVFEEVHRALNFTEERRQVKYECDEVARIILRSKFKMDLRELPMSDQTIIRSLKKPRDTFLKIAGLESFDGLANLSRADLAEMAEEFPKAFAELVVDLYSEMKALKLKNTTQAKTILDLTGKEKEKASA